MNKFKLSCTALLCLSITLAAMADGNGIGSGSIEPLTKTKLPNNAKSTIAAQGIFSTDDANGGPVVIHNQSESVTVPMKIIPSYACNPKKYNYTLKISLANTGNTETGAPAPRTPNTRQHDVGCALQEVQILPSDTPPTYSNGTVYASFNAKILTEGQLNGQSCGTQMLAHDLRVNYTLYCTPATSFE